MDVEAEKQNHA